MKRGIELYAPRLATHKRTWTLAALILILVFFILGEVPVGVILNFGAMKELFPKESWSKLFLNLFFGFGIGALICFAWIRFFEKRTLASIGFNCHPRQHYLRGLISGFGFITVVVGIITLSGGYQFEGDGLWKNFSWMGLFSILMLLIGFAVQGATEEIFMRGWLFQLLTSRYGIAIGIIGNMLYFSSLHAFNIHFSIELAIGLFNIVLVAIMLSLYALKEGNLWGVCAWHGAWNWLLGVGFGLDVSGQSIKLVPLVIDLKNVATAPVWLHGGAFGPEASVVTSFVLLLGIAYFAMRPGHGKVFAAPEIATVENEFETDTDDEPATQN